VRAVRATFIGGLLFIVIPAWPQSSTGTPSDQTKSKSVEWPQPSERGLSLPAEILSDTNGVDFGPYLKGVTDVVRKNWYSLIPPDALPPVSKRGKVVLQFSILKDGDVGGVRFLSSSGDRQLDKAAYGGILGSSPFAPLPSEFKGPNLTLRFSFTYNLAANQGQAEVSETNASSTTTASESVRVSEILISTKTSSVSDSFQKSILARAKAQSLLSSILAGANFEEVASSNSDGPTADRGGDLGYVSRGKLDKSIDDVIFAMEPGEVSGVIPTKQGFVILKVTDVKKNSDTNSSSAANTP